ncbi:DNA mismatch repair endonuclease MutL [Butyricicoccus pullicaecorum]|nr:DNA mismatch repair endonuclease MutL [Butyricicoccus pullicaecorum]
MPIIHELSAHMADLIAAGEVVERPSSVAKELVENAIDAGATQITVEIENGGVTYLRIADNGCGMSPEDAPVAFRRHATSKLRTEADLAAIGTLGFRGEALAAISAVSRIDLFTKQKGTIAGLHLHLDAGELLTQEEAGCPDGTTMIVRDLFYNTPARMKFLKKDFTEAGYVVGVVQHAALSHPEIAFTMLRDGKQVFSTPGSGKLLAPVFAVFGREMTGNLIEVGPFERSGMKVWGYITKPHAGRANRAMQHFFVNGRYVKSRLMQAALEEAYRNKIITGKYPSGAVFLELRLNLVDVNVHPAKTEVKFALEKDVFEIVYAACRNALESNDNVPEIKAHDAPKTGREDNLTDAQEKLHVALPDLPAPSPAQLVRSAPEKPIEAFLGDFAARVSESARPAVSSEPEKVPTEPTTLKLRQTGVKLPYIDVDDEFEDTRPLDRAFMPHAIRSDEDARRFSEEREAVRRAEQGLPPLVASKPASAPVQPEASALSDPVIAKPVSPQPDAPKPAERPAPVQTTLDSGARVLGEAFRTYIIAEDKDGLLLIDKHAAHERMIFNRLRRETDIPRQELLAPVVADLPAAEAAALQEQLDAVQGIGFDIAPFGQNSFAVRAVPAYLDCADIPEVLSEMAEKLLDRRAPTPDRLDDLIHTVSCKAAVKAGMVTSLPELQQFCDRVLADPEVVCCPHGRPVTVRLSKYEMDKMFKRVNQ